MDEHSGNANTGRSELLIRASLESITGLFEKGDYDAALEALQIFWDRPMGAELRACYANLALRLGARFYRERGQPKIGARILQKSVQLMPDSWVYRANAAFMARNFHQYELALQYLEDIPDDVHEQLNHEKPFICFITYIMAAWLSDVVPRSRVRQEIRRYMSAMLMSMSEPVEVARESGQRIRLGYLSGHFGVRNTNGMLAPMFANHDRSSFEIFAYSTDDRMMEAEPRQRVMELVDHWRDLASLDDASAARVIAEDGLHILLDLDGPLAPRLGIAARRPAALLGGWWANVESCGVPLYDFVLSDPVVVPDEQRSQWVEEILHLPVFEIIMPKGDVPPVQPIPPVLRKGYATFGVYSAPFRVNMTLAKAWARMLEAVPNSRFVLRHADMSSHLVRLRCEEALREVGVDLSRVDMIGSTPLDEMLASYGEIDVHLDTYPQNGGNSTLDAIMQGVPNISWLGDAPQSRLGASFLTAIGAPELIAHDFDDFVAKAVALVQAPERLTAYRAGLRDALQRSLIHQPGRFMRYVETALKELLVRRGLAPPETVA